MKTTICPLLKKQCIGEKCAWHVTVHYVNQIKGDCVMQVTALHLLEIGNKLNPVAVSEEKQ